MQMFMATVGIMPPSLLTTICIFCLQAELRSCLSTPSLHLNNRRSLSLLRELRPDRLEHVVLDRLRSRLLSLRLHHLWHGPTSGSELREIGWDERRQPLGPIVKHHNHSPSLTQCQAGVTGNIHAILQLATGLSQSFLPPYVALFPGDGGLLLLGLLLRRNGLLLLGVLLLRRRRPGGFAQSWGVGFYRSGPKVLTFYSEESCFEACLGDALLLGSQQLVWWDAFADGWSTAKPCDIEVLLRAVDCFPTVPASSRGQAFPGLLF